MLFSILLGVVSIAIGIAVKTNKSIKEMISIRNCAYVIMTRDGKVGRRFQFRHGKYTTDKVLTDYDLALVFENAMIGFKTLALGGDTGLQVAMNNYDLKLVGNANIFNFFGVLIAVSMGMMKRK
ncbi:MAG: hypothetical protein NTZ34_13845 [Chloroflexi bacterium]|nr:hypothetical protein [Chloroflexota bacterium]